jgi:hypothetical protein
MQGREILSMKGTYNEKSPPEFSNDVTDVIVGVFSIPHIIRE